MKIFYFIVIPFVVTIVGSNVFAQTKDQYHPRYMYGKWKTGQVQNIITCHVVRFPETGENIALKVFSKAVDAWNNALDRANINIRFQITNASDGDEMMVGKESSTKNLLAFSDALIPEDARTGYGFTTTILPSWISELHTSNIGTFSEIRRGHATIALRSWRAGEQTLTQEAGKVSVYATAVHELGHLLGYGLYHLVPYESIMATGENIYDKNKNYDVDDFKLGAYDIRLLKAMYPTVTSETCLPRQ
jgi:hypothetical protein